MRQRRQAQRDAAARRSAKSYSVPRQSYRPRKFPLRSPPVAGTRTAPCDKGSGRENSGRAFRKPCISPALVSFSRHRCTSRSFANGSCSRRMLAELRQLTGHDTRGELNEPRPECTSQQPKRGAENSDLFLPTRPILGVAVMTCLGAGFALSAVQRRKRPFRKVAGDSLWRASVAERRSRGAIAGTRASKFPPP
jgi:hypothetical protein